MSQMSEEEIHNVDWDAEFQNISHDEVMDARLAVHTEAIETVIADWMSTTIWCKPPADEDDMIDLCGKEFPGATETTLGEVSAIPLLNLFGFLMQVGGVNPDELNHEAIKDAKSFIMNVTASLITEGIMIANSPEWSEKVDAATKGLRDFDHYQDPEVS